MKPAHLRDNPRKLKVNPHQSKDVQSQSPPHKKLLKKIEMLHKDPAQKNDLSLKDDLLAREPKEEVVVDFRVEIERRFNRANANQTYKFPRPKSPQQEDESDGDENSNDTSFESLKHVTIYDLSSQNHRNKKIAQLKHAFQMTVTETLKNGKFGKQALRHPEEDILSSSSSSDEFEEEEKSGVPIEVRIRDKSSATYRKLLKMVDKQLNPEVMNALNEKAQREQELRQQELASSKLQQSNQEQSKSIIRHTGDDDSTLDREHIPIHAHTGTADEAREGDPIRLEQYKKKERSVRSQGRHERVQCNVSDMQRHAKASSNSGIHGVRKNLSQEKMGGPRVDSGITLGSSLIERTFTQLSSSTMKGDSKIDLQKLTQESFKKLYNSNILKSITPQYMKSGQLSGNMKETVFKTFTQENYPNSGMLNMKTPMGSLYQKAKSKVMNSELKQSTTIVNNQARYHVKTNNTSMSATKREETPKDFSRKINFNNFYGSPDSALDKSGRVSTQGGQSSQNNIAKKESVRAFQISSPYKKTATNEGPIVASYDFSSQPRIAKKPSFKLDLNKKAQAYRDVLSTARTRKKRTPDDRCSDIVGADSGLRGSYEMQQYSYILNTSTQKNSNKKQIGFAPSTNTAKSLAFNKAFFSYKQ